MTEHRPSRWLVAAVALLFALWCGLPAGATTPGAPRAIVEPSASIPIELDDVVASPGEIVGGWHGVFIALAVIAFVAIVVVLILEGTHYHVLHRTCEACLHHPPPPPPAPPPAPTSQAPATEEPTATATSP